MEIKVLGVGCSKCKAQFDEARKAIDETGVDATLTKIERLDEIADHGVMFPPALVIDGEVKSSGKVLTAAKIAALLLGLVLLACGGEAPDGTAHAADALAHAGAADAAPARAADARVAKIVFVDQQDACSCTQERIDGTWAELEKALAAGGELPVERIHMDTQAPAAATYLDLRPIMVPPGLYFLDDAGELVEMLQGELTQAQIGALLR